MLNDIEETYQNWFRRDDESAKARWHHMKKPFSNIAIGCTPLDGMTLEDSQSFDVFINVMGNPYHVHMKDKPRKDTIFEWFPATEFFKWSMKHFFWSKQILDAYYEQTKSIYLHCSAGAARSPITGITWLLSKGYTVDEACNIAGGENKNKEYRKGTLEHFFIDNGVIPPIEQIQELYTRMNESPKTYEYEAILDLKKPYLEELAPGFKKKEEAIENKKWEEKQGQLNLEFQPITYSLENLIDYD